MLIIPKGWKRDAKRMTDGALNDKLILPENWNEKLELCSIYGCGILRVRLEREYIEKSICP